MASENEGEEIAENNGGWHDSLMLIIHFRVSLSADVKSAAQVLTILSHILRADDLLPVESITSIRKL